jgi:amino acid transporter
MRSLRPLRRRLAFLVAAMALPLVTVAQGQVARPAAPGPGARAWPLGIIVAAVVIFAIAAMIAAYLANERRAREGGGGPPAHH